MSDKEQKKVYLTPELAALLDAHPRSNSDVTASALNAYLKTKEIADIEERLDELSREITEKQSQINNRKRDLQQMEEERESLKARLNRLEDIHESEDEKLQEAIAKLEDAPRDPDNPAVQTQADKLGMDPEELVQELPERDDGGPRSL